MDLAHAAELVPYAETRYRDPFNSALRGDLRSESFKERCKASTRADRLVAACGNIACSVVQIMHSSPMCVVSHRPKPTAFQRRRSVSSVRRPKSGRTPLRHQRLTLLPSYHSKVFACGAELQARPHFIRLEPKPMEFRSRGTSATRARRLASGGR